MPREQSDYHVGGCFHLRPKFRLAIVGRFFLEFQVRYKIRGRQEGDQLVKLLFHTFHLSLSNPSLPPNLSQLTFLSHTTPYKLSLSQLGSCTIFCWVRSCIDLVFKGTVFWYFFASGVIFIKTYGNSMLFKNSKGYLLRLNIPYNPFDIVWDTIQNKCVLLGDLQNFWFSWCSLMKRLSCLKIDIGLNVVIENIRGTSSKKKYSASIASKKSEHVRILIN